MRMIIEARIEDSTGASEPIRLAEFERPDGDLKQLGLSLAEGRSLTYEAQRALVNVQAQVFVVASRICAQCGAALSIKAKHTIRYSKCQQALASRQPFGAVQRGPATEPDKQYAQRFGFRHTIHQGQAVRGARAANDDAANQEIVGAGQDQDDVLGDVMPGKIAAPSRRTAPYRITQAGDVEHIDSPSLR